MAEPRSALDAALVLLRHRDHAAADLARKLEARGYDEFERDEALATLRRTELLDDRRYAESRAALLAARGAGDALIRFDLDRAGISWEDAEDVLAALSPEAERARDVVTRRGPGPKTARYLSSKGFSEETISALLASR